MVVFQEMLKLHVPQDCSAKLLSKKSMCIEVSELVALRVDMKVVHIDTKIFPDVDRS